MPITLSGICGRGSSIAGMRKGMEFMFPYNADKSRWPHKPDVQHHENWPVRQPSLVFAGLALNRPEHVDVWKRLDGDPTVDEVIRNFVVRQPLLWIPTAELYR